MLSRRTFVSSTLASLALGGARAAAAKLPRVGVIGERGPGDPFTAAFRRGLGELGYVEGRNVAIEYRSAHGDVGRVPTLVSELLRLDVDVLVVGGTVAAKYAKAQTTTVPIVFALAGDPVGSGLVGSLARPGGNATGLSNIISELSAKQLELLKIAVPQTTRVGVLHNPVNPAAAAAVNDAREAARALNLDLVMSEVRRPGELPEAFSSLVRARAQAVLGVSDPVFGNALDGLAKLAGKHRLPAIYPNVSFAEAGGLLSYGPNFSENWRRAASYVDRILKGARPSDLPVERPSKFELVINVKTAQALGLTLSPSLLGRADRLIE